MTVILVRFSDEDLKSKDANGVLIETHLSSTTAHVGDIVQHECRLVERAFIDGPIITFTYKNGTVLPVPDSKQNV